MGWKTVDGGLKVLRTLHDFTTDMASPLIHLDLDYPNGNTRSMQ
jgi:hypothetical protein